VRSLPVGLVTHSVSRYTFLMQYFIPSDSIPRLRVLPTAFNAVPPAVARAAIEQHTQAGDVILDRSPAAWA